MTIPDPVNVTSTEQTPDTTEGALIQQIVETAIRLEQLMDQARRYHLECTIVSQQEIIFDQYRAKRSTVTIQIAKILRRE